MPSYNHYCYPAPWGYYVQAVGVDPTPEGYTKRWGVNETEARQIREGGTVEVVNGNLVITPAAVPNDGVL
jgi:hypothetical protein